MACSNSLSPVADNVLVDDDEFWSSLGTGADTDEFLLFRLRGLSQVSFVSLAAFRAPFQYG